MTNRASMIVGGSTGMALATAEHLAAQGRTALTVGRCGDKLQRARGTLGLKGACVETIRDEVSDKIAVQELIKQIDAEDRHISDLVNTVGTLMPKRFVEHSQKIYNTSQDLNRGTLFVIQAGVCHVKAPRQGSIFNIGSIWAKQRLVSKRISLNTRRPATG